MQRAKHVTFPTKSIRPYLAPFLFVVVSIAGAVPVRAQCNCSQFPTNNTSLGAGALAKATFAADNSAFGYHALNTLTQGVGNTAIGTNSLAQQITGEENTAVGDGSLSGDTTGGQNTGIGESSLANDVTGSHNTAVGNISLANVVAGNDDVAIGDQAGDLLTGGDSNNIDIANRGVGGESNTTRIGTEGTQTRVFIAGIRKSHVFGRPVFVNANGQLGTPGSSKRDIHTMGDSSTKLMKLHPVMFRYKEDPAGTLQYGLLPDEVARVYPELVTYGADGKVDTVAYYMLPAMLLNEMQKQSRENQQKGARIAALQRQLVAQQRQIGILQKETARIDTLTARLSALEEQARNARPRLVTTMR
jgi:hypothetical protein